MKKSVKIVIAIVILLVVALGGGYAIHQYQKNAELKNTNSITNRKGGQDVTWETIKTAAKSNDVLVVFVDSTTPYFNPVMKAVDAEVKQSTKNHPKVLVVDRQKKSSNELEKKLSTKDHLASDSELDPYAIAYKKNEDLSTKTENFVNVHHKNRVEYSNMNAFSTPTNIADSKAQNENFDKVQPQKESDVEVYTKTIKAFFDGNWVPYKDDSQSAGYI